MNTFTITEDHLKLLRRACVGWEDCEYGAPSIDCKRPYGNSFVEGDIAEILGWKTKDDELSDEQYDRAVQIHSETQTALQIVLLSLSDDLVGTYEQEHQYLDRSWRHVE